MDAGGLGTVLGMRSIVGPACDRQFCLRSVARASYARIFERAARCATNGRRAYSFLAIRLRPPRAFGGSRFSFCVPVMAVFAHRQSAVTVTPAL